MAAVWEWQDDAGSWRPYSGQVCCFIEQCLQHHRSAGPAVTTTISLGQSDPSLAAYIIDIPSLRQFRQDTGKRKLSQARHMISPASALILISDICFILKKEVPKLMIAQTFNYKANSPTLNQGHLFFLLLRLGLNLFKLS